MQLSEQYDEFKKAFFRKIIENKYSMPQANAQTIDLMHAITRSEMVNPVRNIGCKSSSYCVWPFQLLLKETYRLFKNCNSDSLIQFFQMETFICKVCYQRLDKSKNNHAVRSYSQFYYDKKLNYLIRASKQIYVANNNNNFDKTDLLLKNKRQRKIINNFKHSKVKIDKHYNAILEYRRHGFEGITYQHSILRGKYQAHQQIIFLKQQNKYALQLKRNLSVSKFGLFIQRSFLETQGCCSTKNRELIKQKIKESVVKSYQNNIYFSNQNQQDYAAYILSNHTDQNRNFQLVVFFPQSNITHIYSLYVNQDIFRNLKYNNIRTVKLGSQILLYTPQTSFLINLSSRPKEHAEKIVYHNPCQNGQVKFFDSIKPLISQPILIVNPNYQDEVFLISGTVQGMPNNKVFKLQQRNWVQQNYRIQGIQHAKWIIYEYNNIFLFVQQQQTNGRILKLKIEERQLRLQTIIKFTKSIKSNAILPVRFKKGGYILMDLTNKEQPIVLNYSEEGKQFNYDCTFKLQQLKRYVKLIGNPINQQANALAYPSNSVIRNDINYLLLSQSRHNNLSVLYGCRDMWSISNHQLSQLQN